MIKKWCAGLLQNPARDMDSVPANSQIRARVCLGSSLARRWEPRMGVRQMSIMTPTTAGNAAINVPQGSSAARVFALTKR